jgi:hypothetical protein
MAGEDGAAPSQDAVTDLPGEASPVDGTGAFDRGESGPIARGPEEFANLVLWLDAAVGIDLDGGGRVATWTDRSPLKHVARPGGVAPSVLPNAWRGHPGVHFDLEAGKTSWLTIDDHSSLRWETGDFALLAVAQHRNPPSPADNPVSYGSLYAKQTNVRPYPGPAVFLNDPWPAFSTSGPTTSGISFQVTSIGSYVVESTRTGFNDGSIHLITALKRARVLRLRIDRAGAGVTTMPDLPNASSPGASVTIGANPFSAMQQLKGEVFALVAITGAVEDSEVAGLERYLSERYELPAPGPVDR